MQTERTDLEKSWLYAGFKSIISSPDIIRSRVIRARKVCAKNNKTGKEDIARYLIRQKLKPSTVLGITTGVVGLVPIMGQISAIATSLSAEFVAVTQQEVELCLEIADNFGYDIADSEVRMIEVLAILGREMKADTVKTVSQVAARKGIKKVVERYARIGLLKSLQRVSLLAQARSGLRAATKAIPALGIGVGGFMNFYCVRKTGLLALQYYRGEREE
ncbi:hypothetical protein ACFL6Y_07540 [Elusimicrobiota bacterium]